MFKKEQILTKYAPYIIQDPDMGRVYCFELEHPFNGELRSFPIKIAPHFVEEHFECGDSEYDPLKGFINACRRNLADSLSIDFDETRWKPKDDTENTETIDAGSTGRQQKDHPESE